HLTGMKGDLAPRTPPPIATAPFASRVAWSAGIRCVLVHHLAERRDPRGQAKAIETRGDFFEGLAHRSKDRLQNNRRQSGRSCDIRLHGVAFLSWNQHPKPTGLRRATPPLLFQHPPGHPLWAGRLRVAVAAELTRRPRT